MTWASISCIYQNKTEKDHYISLNSEGQGNEIILSEDIGSINNFALSPQGDLVAIETEKGIYSLDINSNRVEQISSFGIKPVWRPDGLEIAFEAGDGTTHFDYCAGRWPKDWPQTCFSGFQSEKQILSIRLTENQPIVNNVSLTGYRGVYSPAWSKSGTKFAYLKSDDVNYICVFPYPEWENRKCIWTRDNIETFDWSPSEDRIAFSAQENGISNIYLFDLDNSSQIKLTNNQFNSYSPVWNRSGDKIAFVSDGDGNQEIYMMNADGTKPQNITQNASNDYSPVWSLDDKRIIFVSNRSGNSDIFSVDIESRDAINLTNDPYNEFSPFIWIGN